MNKITFLFANILLVCFLLACNNQATTTAGKDTTNSTASPSQWNDANELEFMSECVDSSKANYNNDSVKAFTFCKCMLKEVKAKYSTFDSTAIGKLMSDSAEVKRIQENCKQ